MAYKRQLGTGIAVPVKKKSVRKTQTKINRDQTQSEAELQKAVLCKEIVNSGLFS